LAILSDIDDNWVIYHTYIPIIGADLTPEKSDIDAKKYLAMLGKDKAAKEKEPKRKTEAKTEEEKEPKKKKKVEQPDGETHLLSSSSSQAKGKDINGWTTREVAAKDVEAETVEAEEAEAETVEAEDVEAVLVKAEESKEKFTTARTGTLQARFPQTVATQHPKGKPFAGSRQTADKEKAQGQGPAEGKEEGRGEREGRIGGI